MRERELQVQADWTSASVARAFMGEVADELHFHGPAKEQLRLAVTEAVANAVEHGAPCDGGLIRVSAYVDCGRLATEVRDCGDFRPTPRETSRLQDRGRGLQLMLASVDDLEINAIPGHTVVRLAKRLP